MNAERWSREFDAKTKDWCNQIAALGADALIDAGIIRRADYQLATEVVSEEIYVRLSMHDYPPPPDSGRGE